MSYMTKFFADHQRTADYHPADQRIILAVRTAVFQTHCKQDPVESMTSILGSDKAAGALVHVLRVIGENWPEPFSVQPPFCHMVSMDERLIVNLITAAVHDNRPGYDHILCEMLDEDVRDHVYNAIQAFIRPYLAARITMH
ncbi:hypothetical protein [Parasphingorhabdus cellanae]|uniref:Uncharacterized protein n=1 Tax=Parasphingorhabdus cellanae TaxID=2806553 RepID=A0ABX7T929_9SPHN|nr:hypothetical protein [Parasphingorhabdus cellanae]QTD56805.1 hypothetical protein J4G78_04310 [Parasphingorhabdus cellanae]